ENALREGARKEEDAGKNGERERENFSPSSATRNPADFALPISSSPFLRGFAPSREAKSPRKIATFLQFQPAEITKRARGRSLHPLRNVTPHCFPLHSPC